jgi:phosphoenolpyruvate-protein kinase (PTS system EI component)
LVQFVSIGTNDLTQFMLAVDRDASELAEDYTVLHPAVLRAIRQVVEACQQADREVCVCGEAAGDPKTACLLVGLGIRLLSMSPVRAAAVRLALRQVERRQLEELAKHALRAPNPETVKHVLDSSRAVADR